MQKSITTSLLLLAALCAQANNYTVKSPDGKLQVNVECEGGKVSTQKITRVSRCSLARHSDWWQIMVISHKISPWEN